MNNETMPAINEMTIEVEELETKTAPGSTASFLD